MNVIPRLTLRPGHDIHVRNRHHAIFKTAVATFPDAPDGSIVDVRASDGTFLCYATLNQQAYICARAIAFEEGDPKTSIKKSIERAVALRSRIAPLLDTDAVRLVNAEGDGLPGLIVDQYRDTLVIQFTTLGLDRMRDWIADVLQECCSPRAIYEKSTGTAHSREGLQPVEGWLRGKGEEVVNVRERGITFTINLVGSQKTGLFLDQREMRSIVASIAKDRTVLDCCSYVGGFGLAALKGGAKQADAVDYDPQAITRAREHVALNGFDVHRFQAFEEDAFNFLRRRPLPHSYDVVVLDPPAFAKRSSDIEQAKRAYTDLNRLGMQALPSSGGFLLTCSCSYHVDSTLFQTIVFHAARQAKRSARILQRHRSAMDHPVNLYHPETDYLKSLLLWVE
jgi:23S rRNA (cytosine1962-C5)-methyltransferase